MSYPFLRLGYCEILGVPNVSLFMLVSLPYLSSYYLSVSAFVIDIMDNVKLK